MTQEPLRKPPHFAGGPRAVLLRFLAILLGILLFLASRWFAPGG